MMPSSPYLTPNPPRLFSQNLRRKLSNTGKHLKLKEVSYTRTFLQPGWEHSSSILMASHTLQSTFFVHFSITPPRKKRKHLVLIRRKYDHLSFVSAPFSKSPFSILDIMCLLKEGHFLPDAFCLLLLFTVSWRP